eukprot:5590302-Alexandrium_andersonii.AAC.1
MPINASDVVRGVTRPNTSGPLDSQKEGGCSGTWGLAPPPTVDTTPAPCAALIPPPRVKKCRYPLLATTERA